MPITSAPTNRAAWLPHRHAVLEVRPAPYTRPRPDEIVVRNHAVAVNPLDWLIQSRGQVVFRWLRYPAVAGSDLAGEVVEVGSAVTRFSIGDRVLALAVGTDKKRNTPAEGAFQHYTVALAHLAAPIPPAMSYEQAAVLPLGLSTAACGLFQRDHLGLRYPSASPVSTGETVLVWGGSTSVGSNAIQLAVAAGYRVVTTAAPHNAEYVRELGASAVFDYRSRSVVADVAQALQGGRIAGALAIGTGSAEACVQVVRACQGNRFVSIATSSVALEEHSVPALVPRLLWAGLSLQLSARRHRVRTKFIFGNTLMDNEVSHVVFEDFLPQALTDRRYRAAPTPQVVGTDLECLQTALHRHRAGVSARKVVVAL